MLDYSHPTDPLTHQTYSVKVPATPEPTLMTQVTKDTTDVRALSTGMHLKLTLVIYEGFKFSFASFNRRPFLPPTLNQAVQEPSKEKEGGMVIAPDDNLWAKTAEALTQLWTSGYSRWNSAGKLLKKATGTASELFLQVLACHFLKRCMHTGTDKEMLLLNCCEGRMVWEHVTLPLLNDRQSPTGFDFL